jgi:adenine-specific DNA methylase
MLKKKVPLKNKDKFVFKKISPTEFEWTLKTSKKEQFFKQFNLFLEKYRALKQKTKFIVKSKKDVFFKRICKEYPKASIFYETVFKKYFDLNFVSETKQKRMIPYTPGVFLITPILFMQKLHLTEKLLIDLEKRKISIDKVLQNDNATLKIVDHLIYRSLFKMSYDDFILEIEDIINKN